MKKTSKIVTLCMAVLMIMQIILPTISQAVNLNIQFERPYNDDDGDSIVGDDVYTLALDASQTVFKIGEHDAEGDLSFNEAYYCLRGGLGFGSTEEILQSGVEYTKSADLSDKIAVMAYFKDTIGHELTEENYNAICWIADNMYLPNSPYAKQIKAKLLEDAEIITSLLTDDDIEVIQQIALWYFTNYDENGEGNSVSLADSSVLANLLQIDGMQPDNDLTVAYNKNRAKQINTLYRYFIDSAKSATTETTEKNNYITTAEILIADADDQPVLKIKKQGFDLALRKFITKAGENELTGELSRIPSINLESLKTGETTAIYNHPKTPIYLKRGDTIIYTIRIYNEGDLDGYATEVTDYLCDGLELVENSTINQKYLWDLQADGKTLKSKYLENTLIKAYNPEITEESAEIWQKSADGADGLYYADLQVECKIKDTAAIGKTLPNIAEITEDKTVEITFNENNEDVLKKVDVEDRDSEPNSLKEADIRNYENNPWYEDDDDYERVIIEDNRAFDLALRIYISNIERNGENLEFASRQPEIDTTPLTKNISTANYNHPKDVLTVKNGDIITYKLRIYNEAELDGYATQITDFIPEGLGLLVGYSGNSNWLIKTTELNSKPLIGENGIYKTIEEVAQNGIFKDEDLSSMTVVTSKSGNLEIEDSFTLKDKLIKKYGAEVNEGDLFQVSINNEEDGLFYQEIEVTCIVLVPNTYQGVLTNLAEINEDKAVEITMDENNDKIETEIEIEDRDSRVYNVLEDDRHTPGTEINGYTPGEQDDDDFEPVQLKYFDLALRKFITGVNEEAVDTRIPEVKIEEDGKITYEHDKTPVEVVDNDNVTYTIRVYNEGTISGYAEEVEDDIPEGLIFLPDDEINKKYGWKMYYYNEEGVLVETENEEEAEVIRTTYLSETNGIVNEETGENSNLLKLFDKQTMETPDYRDLKVVFKVEQEDVPEENEDGIIINKAHITEDSDDDEDSIPDEWNENEDDQDKEYIYVQKFDLALFKWVTHTIVTVDGKTTTTETGFKPNIGKTEAKGDYRENNEEEPIASVTIDKKKLNSTDVKFVYNIKVVNEGDIEGYVTEVTDYIPEGLKFVTEDNPLWTLEEGNKITTRALETKLLKPGESAEIPVTFTWINDANNLGLKTNIAAITEDYNEYGVPDEDSTPNNEDIPNYDKEQEDDDDFALVILTLKTGNAVSYIWLMLLTITIISTGAILIKKYVL